MPAPPAPALTAPVPALSHHLEPLADHWAFVPLVPGAVGLLQPAAGARLPVSKHRPQLTATADWQWGHCGRVFAVYIYTHI